MINRERRRVYREIYDHIKKHMTDFKLPENLHRDQKHIVDNINEVKKRFLALKGEQVYIDLITGRLNQKIC